MISKKVKGRERHLGTDTLGLLLAVTLTAATVQDRDAAMPTVDLAKQKVPGIETLFVDAGYAGSRAREMRAKHDIDIQVVRHPANRNVGRWHQVQLPLRGPRGRPIAVRRHLDRQPDGWAARSVESALPRGSGMIER